MGQAGEVVKGSFAVPGGGRGRLTEALPWGRWSVRKAVLPRSRKRVDGRRL